MAAPDRYQAPQHFCANELCQFHAAPGTNCGESLSLIVTQAGGRTLHDGGARVTPSSTLPVAGRKSCRPSCVTGCSASQSTRPPEALPPLRATDVVVCETCSPRCMWSRNCTENCVLWHNLCSGLIVRPIRLNFGHMCAGWWRRHGESARAQRALSGRLVHTVLLLSFCKIPGDV